MDADQIASSDWDLQFFTKKDKKKSARQRLTRWNNQKKAGYKIRLPLRLNPLLIVTCIWPWLP